MRGDVYWPEEWPGLRAPAEIEVRFTDRGEPYPSASLWVRLPDGTDDLWWSSSIPIWSGRGGSLPRVVLLHRALREAVMMGRKLEEERDEFYAEWMPWEPLRHAGLVLA